MGWGGTRARGGGSKGFGSGGVGGRDGANFATCLGIPVKWGGGYAPWWTGGALVAGEGWGGRVGAGWQSQRRLFQRVEGSGWLEVLRP